MKVSVGVVPQDTRDVDLVEEKDSLVLKTLVLVMALIRMNLVEGERVPGDEVVLHREKEEKDFFRLQISFLVQIVVLITSPGMQAEKQVLITSQAALAGTFQLLMVTPQPAGNAPLLCKGWTWLPYHHARDPGMMALELLITEIWILVCPMTQVKGHHPGRRD